MSRYEVEKFDPTPDPDLICCICHSVLDSPVQSPCRHVFCKVCIETWLKTQHTCPTCREYMNKSNLKPVIPLIQGVINRLTMFCDFHDNGCDMKILLENYFSHVKSCDYEMLNCKFTKCGKSVLRRNCIKHEETECQYRETQCDNDCGLMVPFKELTTHNCLTALKQTIEEKNVLIDTLKNKVEELQAQSDDLNRRIHEMNDNVINSWITSSQDSWGNGTDITEFSMEYFSGSILDEISDGHERDADLNEESNQLANEHHDTRGTGANQERLDSNEASRSFRNNWRISSSSDSDGDGEDEREVDVENGPDSRNVVQPNDMIQHHNYNLRSRQYVEDIAIRPEETDPALYVNLSPDHFNRSDLNNIESFSLLPWLLDHGPVVSSTLNSDCLETGYPPCCTTVDPNQPEPATSSCRQDSSWSCARNGKNSSSSSNGHSHSSDDLGNQHAPVVNAQYIDSGSDKHYTDHAAWNSEHTGNVDSDENSHLSIMTNYESNVSGEISLSEDDNRSVSSHCNNSDQNDGSSDDTLHGSRSSLKISTGFRHWNWNSGHSEDNFSHSGNSDISESLASDSTNHSSPASKQSSLSSKTCPILYSEADCVFATAMAQLQSSDSTSSQVSSRSNYLVASDRLTPTKSETSSYHSDNRSSVSTQRSYILKMSRPSSIKNDTLSDHSLVENGLNDHSDSDGVSHSAKSNNNSNRDENEQSNGGWSSSYKDTAVRTSTHLNPPKLSEMTSDTSTMSNSEMSSLCRSVVSNPRHSNNDIVSDDSNDDHSAEGIEVDDGDMCGFTTCSVSESTSETPTEVETSSNQSNIDTSNCRLDSTEQNWHQSSSVFFKTVDNGLDDHLNPDGVSYYDKDSRSNKEVSDQSSSNRDGSSLDKDVIASTSTHSAPSKLSENSDSSKMSSSEKSPTIQMIWISDESDLEEAIDRERNKKIRGKGSERKAQNMFDNTHLNTNGKSSNQQYMNYNCVNYTDLSNIADAIPCLKKSIKTENLDSKKNHDTNMYGEVRKGSNLNVDRGRIHGAVCAGEFYKKFPTIDRYDSDLQPRVKHIVTKPSVIQHVSDTASRVTSATCKLKSSVATIKSSCQSVDLSKSSSSIGHKRQCKIESSVPAKQPCFRTFTFPLQTAPQTLSVKIDLSLVSYLTPRPFPPVSQFAVIPNNSTVCSGSVLNTQIQNPSSMLREQITQLPLNTDLRHHEKNCFNNLEVSINNTSMPLEQQKTPSSIFVNSGSSSRNMINPMTVSRVPSTVTTVGITSSTSYDSILTYPLVNEPLQVPSSQNSCQLAVGTKQTNGRPSPINQPDKTNFVVKGINYAKNRIKKSTATTSLNTGTKTSSLSMPSSEHGQDFTSTNISRKLIENVTRVLFSSSNAISKDNCVNNRFNCIWRNSSAKDNVSKISVCPDMARHQDCSKKQMKELKVPIQTSGHHESSSQNVQKQSIRNCVTNGTGKNRGLCCNGSQTASTGLKSRVFPHFLDFLVDSDSDDSDVSWMPETAQEQTDESFTEEAESDSSYEVCVPKTVAQLLDEYASDESDNSWTAHS